MDNTIIESPKVENNVKPKKFDMKKYKEDNKEKFKNYNNNYQKQIIMCTCGSRINYGSRRYHVKSNKHLNKINQIALMKENNRRIVINEKEDEAETEYGETDRYDMLKSILIKINKNLEDLKFYKKDEHEAGYKIVEEQFKRLRDKADKADDEEYEGFEEKE